MRADAKLPLLLLAIVAAVLAWSAIAPADRATWWAEVAPVLIGVPIMLATFRRHPLTPLLYTLIAIHCVILVVGGQYTYAKVPLGFWMQEWFDFTRNHYDRIGHFAQGFVPAILAREVLLRSTPLRRGGCKSFECFGCKAERELRHVENMVGRKAALGARGPLGLRN